MGIGFPQPGGGGAQTVNGIAPDGGGNITLTAADITSTGPSDVQADLDLLAGSVLSSVKKFESWAEFAALATEAPVGTFTISQQLVGSGTILVPSGSKIVGISGSAITGSNVQGLTFIFDVDDATISGVTEMRDMTIVQNSVGASAVGLEIIAPDPAKAQVFQTMQVIGGRVGILIGTVASNVKLETVFSLNADVGFRVTASTASLTCEGIGTQSVVAGHRGFDLDAGATVLGGLLVNIPSFSLSTGQFGFSIAHAATFAGKALLQVAGASNTGPQDAMFRQTAPGVTDMAIDDNRLVVKGGPSVANWGAQAVASRFDDSDPLIVDNSAVAAGVPAVIPYEDGAGNLEIVSSIESHFTFFKNVADPLDWYFEYTGPLSDATVRLASDILADRANIGPSTAILCWERAPFLDPGHGAFVAVPDSDVPWENTNSITPRSGLATFKGANNQDRFRPVISDSSTTDVRLSEIKLDLSIGS